MNKSLRRHEDEVRSLNNLSCHKYEAYWDNFYSSNEYIFLENLSEIGRMGVIIEYLLYLNNINNILDVGCGVGNLCKLLPEKLKSGYTGIDVCKNSIQIAIKKYPEFKFLQCKAEMLDSKLKFDAIILSEILYYLNYGKVLKMLRNNLSSRGIFICSLYKAPSSSPILDHIELQYKVINSISIKSETYDLEWYICCFKIR